MLSKQLSFYLKNKNKNNLFFVIGSFFIELIITLIITKLISIALSKSDFGEYSLFLSVFAIISVLPFFSLHTSIERLLIENEDKKVVITSVFLLYIFFFILYSLVLVFFTIFNNEFGKQVLIVFYFFCLSKIMKTTIIAIININKYNKEAFFLRFFDSIIQFFIVIFYFICKNLTLNIIFLSSIISSFIVLLFGVYLIKKIFFANKKELGLKSSYIKTSKEIMFFSAPLIFWGLFIWIQNMVGRWYIDAMVDRDNVANYSLMTSLALLPVTAIISIFGGFFVPRIYLHEKEFPGFIAKINKKIQFFSFLFWIVIVLFSFFFGEFLIKVFLSDKYLEVAWALPLLLLGNAIHCIGQLSIYEIYYYKKPRLLILSNVIPGILTISLGYFLIKNYGFFGAIISNLISFSISGILALYSTKIFSKRRIYAN